MAFRNNQDAALARADALQRELDEQNEALAAKQAELQYTAARLAAAQAKLDEAEESDEAEATSEAGRKLAALKATAAGASASAADTAAQQESRAESTAASNRKAEHKRLRVSVSWFGDMHFGLWAFMLLIPGIWMAFWLSIRLGSLGLGVLLAAASCVTLAGLCTLLTTLYVRRRITVERAWARALPYELPGYPQMLGRKPAPEWHDDDGHRSMAIRLTFRGESPDGLAEILKGFDEQISLDSDGRFVRPSPVTSYHRKGIERFPDSNAALRTWIRDFADVVLAPLHELHPVDHVVISLSSERRS